MVVIYPMITANKSRRWAVGDSAQVSLLGYSTHDILLPSASPNPLEIKARTLPVEDPHFIVYVSAFRLVPVSLEAHFVRRMRICHEGILNYL